MESSMGLVEISLLVRWLLGWFLCLRMPALPEAPNPAGGLSLEARRGALRLSVLIPARNEEGTLPHLLAALARQSLQPLEVIVIDDHSSDGTTAVASGAGALVLQAPPLPAGWCGKTWALHHGVLASGGECLVFLDADTVPGPRFLEHLLATQQRLGGLVSVQPFHRTEKPYEQLSLLFNLVGLMAVPLGPNVGVAFGPAMATSRADYQQSGGHAAVAGQVVEDWFLAHLYERAALPVSAFIGRGQIEYRMYPGGLRDMVIGFSKNFATAAAEVRWPWLLGVLLWISGLFWAAWCLPAALLGWPLVGNPDPWLNAAIYGAFALQLGVLSRRVGSFGWINLVFPIPVLFFLGVFLTAILNLERGTIEWKGRQIPTR
ncbi:glycosyltransferase family 2 protein [Vulcanococcus limneticus]|uniref:glycosyltransferase family 2 protein n=1 Tax=Vulcanococcus limneticus TaxID=2170428 RepID=UPI00398BDB4E